MNSLYKLYHPEIFQGSLQSNSYFEGWYHKHTKNDESFSFALIPGISTGSDAHSFIQYIDGISGKTSYFKFPLESFKYNKKKYQISIDNNHFSSEEISFDLSKNKTHIKGNLTYSENQYYPVKIFSPGIMGPFSFIPKMQCVHGVVSVNHFVNGTINISGREINFDNDKGYIEKDRGYSFPSDWIWLQANNFTTPDTSIFFSVAHIPMKFKSFYGFICFFYHKSKFYNFSTYNRSKILNISLNKDILSILLQKGKSTIQLDTKVNFGGTLTAPHSGSMSRIMKESLSSEIEVKLFKKNNLIFSGQSHSTGAEISGEIIDIFQNINR